MGPAAMFEKPDYDTLRKRADFRWFVQPAYLALLELTGVPIREFYLEPSAGIEVYRRGRPLLREMFGADVPAPGISSPPISYGHANALGSELLFPEGGEVAHTHPFDSLEKAIEALRQPVDFHRAGMAQHYIEYRKRLQEAFPGEQVGFGFGLEGPLTTGYELRGDGFFLDIMDRPELAGEFLRLTTESIAAFHRFRSEVLDVPAISPDGAGMADDIASFVPPRLWGELVLPNWERYFQAKTTGQRRAHVENLRGEQLPFLEQIGLVRFDPSISPALNPRIISERCRVPFDWRLGSIHFPYVDCREVRDFVFQAVADGAGGVFLTVSNGMCNEPSVRKVRSFIEAAREVERMLVDGADRRDVARCVSESGKERFWAHWPE